MAEVIRKSEPTARKDHRCDSCNRRIAKGERYSNAFVVDGGDNWTYRAHIDCMEAMRIMFAAGIEGDEGAWRNVCEADPEDREVVFKSDPDLAARVWPGQPVAVPTRENERG